jgi:hypothetical protein
MLTLEVIWCAGVGYKWIHLSAKVQYYCQPGWKTDLLAKSGRKILVQYVLTSMLIYLAMVIDIPARGWKAIDKLRRGFFWRGRKEAKGGHC